jgi:hypothetical protein
MMRYPCGLSLHVPFPETSDVTGASLQKLLISHHRLFGDSLSADTIAYLWDLFGKNNFTSPPLQNFLIFTAMLEKYGYSVIALQPATYESIVALSKLPVILWLIVITYPDKSSLLISDTTISIFETGRLAGKENLISLHSINAIEKTVNMHRIITSDGRIFNGTRTDTLQGQITTIPGKNGSVYTQIIDCICISLLPQREINNHLNDWYKNIPDQYIKPRIRDFHTF